MILLISSLTPSPPCHHTKNFNPVHFFPSLPAKFSYKIDLEDALRKQISLQYLLGIHKLHDIHQEKHQVFQSTNQAFQNLKALKIPNNLQKDQREIALLKEHLNEEILRLKDKKQELDLLREEIVLQPWDCMKDPQKLKERMLFKQEELWTEFQKDYENEEFEYPKNEKLWGFLSQNPSELSRFREVIYQYQEFLMQEHVRLGLLKQKLQEESENNRKEQISFEKERVLQLDYEVFEETKQKMKDELFEERTRFANERKKMNCLIKIMKNYQFYKENRALDWESSNDEFIIEIFDKINQENDVFEKDARKKQQIKRLKEELQKLLNENLDNSHELQIDPYERIAGVLGNINSYKENSQEDEIQKKLFKRKEEMLQHKQKELEALKKLLEKESFILQEEKIWLVNEKNKLTETTKKSLIYRDLSIFKEFYKKLKHLKKKI